MKNSLEMALREVPLIDLKIDYSAITVAAWEWIMEHEVDVLMAYTRKNMIRLGLDKTNA